MIGRLVEADEAFVKGFLAPKISVLGLYHFQLRMVDFGEQKPAEQLMSTEKLRCDHLSMMESRALQRYSSKRGLCIHRYNHFCGWGYGQQQKQVSPVLI